jgi:hypothetical protein
MAFGAIRWRMYGFFLRKKPPTLFALLEETALTFFTRAEEVVAFTLFTVGGAAPAFFAPVEGALRPSSHPLQEVEEEVQLSTSCCPVWIDRGRNDNAPAD